MKNSFGKPIGTAARVKKGQAVFSVYTTKDKLAVAKHALKRASYILAGSYIISASKNE